VDEAAPHTQFSTEKHSHPLYAVVFQHLVSIMGQTHKVRPLGRSRPFRHPKFLEFAFKLPLHGMNQNQS